MPEPMVRAAALVGLAALALGLGGCSADRAHAHPTEPHAGFDDGAYSYVLASSCGERLLIGTFRVSVDGGRVTSVEGVDENGIRLASSRHDLATSVPTIDALLIRIRENPAAVADVTYDRSTGAPASVRFDPDRHSVDDEECYAVSDVRLGS